MHSIDIEGKELSSLVKNDERAALYAVRHLNIAQIPADRDLPLAMYAVAAWESAAMEVVRKHPKVAELKGSSDFAVAHVATNWESVALEVVRRQPRIAKIGGNGSDGMIWSVAHGASGKHLSAAKEALKRIELAALTDSHGRTLAELVPVWHPQLRR